MGMSGIITRNFMPTFEDLNLDGSDPRRVTLLYKQGDSLVCLINRDLEEVRFDRPVRNAFLLEMFGESRDVSSFEEIRFHKKDVGNVSYVVTESKEDLNPEKVDKRKVPYVVRKDFCSDVVLNGEGLDAKIDEMLKCESQKRLTHLEEIADKGLIRCLMGTEKIKQINQACQESWEGLYYQLISLFHEEQDSVPVGEHDIRDSDKRLKDLFKDPRKLKRLKQIGKTINLGALVALLPPNSIELLEYEVGKKYNKRFKAEQTEEEKAGAAIGNLLFKNPKALPGIRRGYAEFKRYADITTYGSQLALTSYALFNWSPWLSVPLLVPTVISGITRVNNLVRSGFQDYGGVVSTILRKAIDSKIQDLESENKPNQE